jgi:TolB protein
MTHLVRLRVSTLFLLIVAMFVTAWGAATPVSAQKATITPTPSPTIARLEAGQLKGQLLFKSNRAGSVDMYTLDLETLEYLRIPTSAGGVSDPAPAPDGQKVAYVSTVIDAEKNTQSTQIFVIGLDGSDETQLTKDGDNYGPVWSPDGKSLIFVSTRDSQGTKKNFEIYSMAADGSNQKRLTTSPAFDAEAGFFPDGKKITFTSDRSGYLQVYTADLDGKNVKRITVNNFTDTFPDISPDGKTVLFISDKTSKDRNKADNRQMFTAAVTGGAAKQLTTVAKPNPLMRPRWSPDGKHIVYGNTLENGNWAVFIITADGKTFYQVTDGEFSEGDGVRWMPAPTN